MDDLVKDFSLWGLLSLATMCYVGTFFTRRILTTAMPWLEPVTKDGKETYTCGWARWYNKVLLYAIPVVLGLLFALIPSKFLFGEIDSFGGKLFFSGTIGWFSSMLYKLFRVTITTIFAQKFGVKYEPKDPPLEGSKET